MTTPHKHADVLHAIAEGKEVQYKHRISHAWVTPEHVNPISNPEVEWRVKPEPKPDVVMYARVHEPRKGNIAAYITNAFVNAEAVGQPNLRIYYCGETGKLKKAEVIE